MILSAGKGWETQDEAVAILAEFCWGPEVRGNPLVQISYINSLKMKSPAY